MQPIGEINKREILWGTDKGFLCLKNKIVQHHKKVMGKVQQLCLAILRHSLCVNLDLNELQPV